MSTDNFKIKSTLQVPQPPKNEVPKIPKAVLPEFGVQEIKKSSLNNPKPEYYSMGGVEVFDFLQAYQSPQAFKGFLHANAIKYLARLYYKDTPVSNLLKALTYIEKLLELESEKK